MRTSELRQVGIGELLARLERLKQLLAAEGLFAPDLKRRLPFLPGCVGLITGRASAAERDVVENARRRFAGVRFALENVAVQGVNAVPEIVAALQRLDADPAVEVIVVARGGGSVEDLLPFSNETLVRAVARCRTPVVSAIGHETDVPLLDHVADLAASTPTDAAKRVVPDLTEEQRCITELRQRGRDCTHRRLEREAELMAGLPERMRAAVHGRVLRESSETAQWRERIRRTVRQAISSAAADLQHLRAQVATLSPQATLDRGYAVVQRHDGTVVRQPGQAEGRLRVRVARGEFDAVVA
jgi:exodeoxyribonuclease VII large subunit